jgi:hypothetical protein
MALPALTNGTARNWIAVASADHVQLGRELGIMQVSHGNSGPLRRLRPGDRIIYYSPSRQMGMRDGLQCFTAFGLVADDVVYQVNIGNGFHPFRRKVDYLDAQEAPIRSLLEQLSFTRARRNWGYALRFGLLEIDVEDLTILADAMGIGRLDRPINPSPRQAGRISRSAR